MAKKLTPLAWIDQVNKRPRQDQGLKEEGVDTWIENKLRSAYSSVLDEPIPEDLIRLLQQSFKDP